MPSEQQQRIRVAIIGAGIGGLTLSAALGAMKRHNSVLEVDIYEGSPRISSLGAGIGFWTRTWKVMKKIGLDQDLLQFLPEAPNESSITSIFEVRKADQREGFYIEDIRRKGGAIWFHRADLQKTLLNHVEGKIHLSHRLVRYVEVGNGIQLQFENGKSAWCDLIIGMDGINSVVRKCFLTYQGVPTSPSMNPVWSGYTGYRALIQASRLRAENPHSRALQVPMLHIVTYPVSSGEIINAAFWTFEESNEGSPFHGQIAMPCTIDEISSMFCGWEQEVQQLVKCIENPSKWCIRELKPMERYSKGRVILCGDAAHAMTPFDGGGAAQAIEDAYVLSGLLSDEKCQIRTLSRISEIYNSVRRPLANWVLEKSKRTGKAMELMLPEFDGIGEGDVDVPLEKLKELIYDIQKGWAWVGNTSPEDEMLRALNMLHSKRAV
ncbi:hypothetical protein CVT26_001323 [Gymnopilus dilepis]|uniref:FAD-binding domain-containing protein n=1 Tax=Gymnopilus dilepis TaxID=231916 RepID=A0A409YM39_9AGAR|nr:hypothetical protein CVT26_001323 [Gymnopilus dilepis]